MKSILDESKSKECVFPPYTLREAQRAIADDNLPHAEFVVGELMRADTPQREAWCLWVKVAWRQGRLEVARARADHALKVHPDDADLHVIDARIQFSLGHCGQALERITEAILRWPDHTGLQVAQLDLLRNSGKKIPALPILRQLRRQGILNASKLMAAARFYRSHGRLQATNLVLCYILEHHPQHAKAMQMHKEISLQIVQRAMNLGDLRRAEFWVDHLMSFDDPPPAVWRRWVQIAFRSGRLNCALQRAEQALVLQPHAPELHALEARIQSTAGAPYRALERVKRALEHWPNHAGLRVVQIDLLNQVGAKRAVLSIVHQLRKNDIRNPHLLMAVARFYRAHGRLRATMIILEHLIRRHPEYRPARIMRQHVMATSGKTPDSIELTDMLWRLKNGPQSSPAELAELIHALKRIGGGGIGELLKLRATWQDIITLLSKQIHLLTDQDKLAFLNEAERFGHAYAVGHTLSMLLKNGPRTSYVALALYRKVIASVSTQQAEEVAIRLLRNIPEAQKTALAAEFSLHLHGPKRALARFRQDRCKRRSLPEARQLIKFLQLADPNGLGLRYLRLCRRRWPEDVDLRVQQARLLINTGRPDAALDVLNTYIPALKRSSVAHARVLSLLDLSKIGAAQEELKKIGNLASAQKLSGLRLQVLVTAGRESDAKEALHEAQLYSTDNRIRSGHTSISLLGHYLNDLILFNREQAALPPNDHNLYLVTNYFHPAMKAIERHVQKEVVYPNDSLCIPRQIIQYWDQRIIPNSVADVMRSWSNSPETEYKLFDRRRARSFIMDTFGSEYERAFRMTKNVAEGADFFRLCYLRHHGGIYIDADDRLHGDLNKLLPTGAALVCYRERFGALANNFIAATPEHPAIVHASKMAADALLARDSDSTWSKTGPGLLTRAVAHYLLTETSTALRERIAILPEYRLRRHVQIHMTLPHKKTSRHWNRENAKGVNMMPYFSHKAELESAEF